VALVTGEEKIKPKAARYWICTVEAMPRDLDLAFVAIDEIQLAPISTGVMSSPTACSTGAAATRRSSSAPRPWSAPSGNCCPARIFCRARACRA
jgi:hypothetical protein